MKEEGKHRLYRLMKDMEEGINRIKADYEDYFSIANLKVIKRIIRMLRVMVMEGEREMVERKVKRGKCTPKQARSERAKIRKRWT